MAPRAPSPSYQDLVGPIAALRDATLLHGRGRLDEAEQRYRIVLGADSGNFEALYRLGLIRLQQARFSSAAKFFRRALKVQRQSLPAQQHLGIALSGLGEHREAVRLYEKVLASDPDYAEAHNNLAHSLQILGRHDEAAAHYERALAVRPDYAEARNNLGVILQLLQRPGEAIMHYEAALALRPNYVEARKNLGNVMAGLNRQPEAASQFELALALRPDDAEARLALGNALLKLDQPERAMSHFQDVLARASGHVEARNGLGAALQMLGRSEEAVAVHRAVLAIKPNDIEAHSKLGEALLSLGRLDDANAAMARAVALAPGNAGYYWNLANSKRFAADDPQLAAMRALARDLAGLNAEQQIDLHFALGKGYGDVGAHRQSFAHLREGNAMMRQRVRYDEVKALGRFAWMRRVFTAALMRDRSGLGDPSTAPVFIIGMPRSGTTLIEQILASHPRIFGAGELGTLASVAEQISGLDDGGAGPEAVPDLSAERLRRVGADYVVRVRRHAPEAERITDKMPGNFLLAGLIHLALPNARIIHACRDLRDTAFSCFSLLFTSGQIFSYELAELGRYCRGYRELMAHWHEVMPGVILDVHYEEVVGDLEGQARRLIAHCGLDWDDGCLNFQRSRRSVRTASAAQVRQPIYTSSIGRWRVHEENLQPLLRELS